MEAKQHQRIFRGMKYSSTKPIEQSPSSTVIDLQYAPPKRVYINPGFLSFFLVSWITPLLKLGAKRPLQAEDMYELNEKDQAITVCSTMSPFWQDVSAWLADPSKPKPSLWRLLVDLFFWRWLISGGFLAVSLACQLAIPTFMQQLLIYLNIGGKSSQPLLINSGIGISFIIFGLLIATSIFGRTSEQLTRRITMNVRTLLIGAVYEKSLKLSGRASRDFSQGRIMNMINVDAEQISLTVQSIHQLWATPIQIGISLFLLFNLLGSSVWAGAVTMFAMLALLGFFIVFIAKAQRNMLKAGDGRLRGIREMLYAIKIIKLNAWEDYYMKIISTLREAQTNSLRNYYIGVAFFISLSQVLRILMPIVTIVIYSGQNADLNSSAIFPALTLFSQLFNPIFLLPSAITAVMMALVSLKRISAFLLSSERQPLTIAVGSSVDNFPAQVYDDKIAIDIIGATFKWEAVKVEEKENKGRKLERKNAAEANGSNKTATSTDLASRTQGATSSMAGASEPSAASTANNSTSSNTSDSSEAEEVRPFIKNLNLRITRGELTAIVGQVGAGKSSLLAAITGEMTKVEGKVDVYGTVALCAQQPWIQTETIMSNILFGREYDLFRLTKIVHDCSLEADIDQLPAGLDTEIGEKGVNLSGGQKARIALARALYDDADILLLDDPLAALDATVGHQVFHDCIKTALKGKTRVLVTHQLQILQSVDRIIVLHDGAVVESGSFPELMVAKGTFTKMMKDHKFDEQKEGEKDGVGIEGSSEIAGAADKEKKGGAIITAEDRATGAVALSTYKAYFKHAGGWPSIVAIFLIASFSQVATIMNQYWLVWWTDDRFNETANWYLLGYGLLGVAQGLSIVLLNAAIIFAAYIVSRKLHRVALKSILAAPMSFFDTQPIGRILNRMSKDVEAIDQQLWSNLFAAIVALFTLLGVMVLISIVSPYMLILIAPLCVLYCVILKFYSANLRELKRLDSNLRSPLYSLVSESLGGISAIRAYKAEQRFVEKQRELMNISNSPYYLNLSSGIWVSLRIEFLTSFITLFLAILGTTLRISPEKIGLSLSYTVTLMTQINQVLKTSALLEANMNAVERVDFYCTSLPQESPAVEDTDPPKETWPSRGEISISNLELTYESRPDHPVLHDLSLEVRPGEKVGIVGRTGSGKSTLLTALFRLVNPSKGQILIDGYDISRIGLKTLRSRLQIIAQEPVLFTGTIRNNLDIDGSFDDTELWEVLDDIGLKTYISSLPGKLDAVVVENGENLSVGQRQLMCLGRAILKKPVVLVMDEATASVDAEADKLIQRSIKTHFANSTVLSIAHRLNTIADFDRVLVLDNGVRVEYDTPYALLARPDSLFAQLAEATGQSNAQLLREIAAEHEREMKNRTC